MNEGEVVHDGSVGAERLLVRAFELVLLDEMPVVRTGAAFEEIAEGGAGVALGFVAVLEELVEGGVIVLDGLVRGF